MRALIAFLLLFPTLALSQGAATLVADTVMVEGGTQLVAEGNIEVFYDNTRLSASRVVFDQTADRLTISGPILIQSPNGTIITADQASLDPKLENGILRGARLVLAQQLQLAATQIDRIDGRFSQLYKVAVTSCNVCGNRPPLWEIRAKKIVHDEDAQQLYFTDTQFLIRGTQVLWLPNLRLPDPTLTRATGLLIPDLKQTEQLGTGIKLPYFIRLGDHRDITLTPYISLQTTTLEAQYRQAFVRGDLTIDAAVSQDKLQAETRSYVFAEGTFDLTQDYTLNFDIESATDSAYLLDYGYSDKDRLDSAATLLRVRDTDLTQANLTYFQTLRDDEDNASLPPLIGSVSYEKRVFSKLGTFKYATSADTLYRYGTGNGDAGRDVSRVGADASLTRDWITQGGLVMQATAGLRADWYGIADDAAFENGVRVAPNAAVSLRYPLALVTDSGAQHLLTPAVVLAWADSYGIQAPNEDSTRSELDQANLFDPSRFAGEDAVEFGSQAAIGATWTRIGARGATSTLTFGRVLRNIDIDAFNPSSGLDERSSDWLLAGQYNAPSGFKIDGRTLFDDDASLTRAATRLGWKNDLVDLNAAYIWQAADPTESRPDAVSEWTLASSIDLTPAWTVDIDTRYDLANDQPASAGLSVYYKNECVTVDFSVSRRYTSSTTVDASTSFGLEVSLNGFSANGSAGPAAACAP